MMFLWYADKTPLKYVLLVNKHEKCPVPHNFLKENQHCIGSISPSISWLSAQICLFYRVSFYAIEKATQNKPHEKETIRRSYRQYQPLFTGIKAAIIRQ
jgi:hypothetical protein